MRYLRLALPIIISGPFIEYYDAIQFRGFLKFKMIGAQDAHSMINSVIFDK
jgi:hypothetical protein